MILTRSSEPLTSASFLEQFSCVVMCNAPLEVQYAVNDYCHGANKQFISCEVYKAAFNSYSFLSIRTPPTLCLFVSM